MDLYRKIIIFCRGDQNFKGMRMGGKLYKAMMFLSRKQVGFIRFGRGLAVSKGLGFMFFVFLWSYFFEKREGWQMVAWTIQMWYFWNNFYCRLASTHIIPSTSISLHSTLKYLSQATRMGQAPNRCKIP